MDPLGWMPFHLQNNPNRGAVAGLMGGAAAVISDIAGVKGLRRNVATKDEPIETARVGILGATIGAAAELGKSKAAPEQKALDLKQKHTCGQCGKTMSLHTALYSHKCPKDVSIPQPPALVRQPAPEPAMAAPPATAAIPEPVYPQYSHSQLLRMQLAQAAQERKAQAQLRMTAPIRQFYGLS